MPKMRAAQVPKPGADVEIVEREIPQPGPGSVRIRIQACGVCHSDAVTKEGLYPAIKYPLSPGHEVASVIDEIGAGVAHLNKGRRVGVGWHGGQCGWCKACRRRARIEINKCSIRAFGRCSRCKRFSCPCRTQSPHGLLRAAQRLNLWPRRTAHALRRQLWAN
jgi:D-arabinose 1-dehydrogenase-like Zn-dependent alcohol dehydrogenase